MNYYLNKLMIYHQVHQMERQGKRIKSSIFMNNNNNTLFPYFSEMHDFRINRKKQYLLSDIITITIAATLSGCNSYDDIEDFAVVREEWFRTFLELPNGIPSHDRINRVFSNMDPVKFEQCFRNWVNAILEDHQGQLISIDGKTIRGAKLMELNHPSTWEALGPMRVTSYWGR